MSSRAYLWFVATSLSWVQFTGTAEVRVVGTQTRVPVKGATTSARGENGKTDAIDLISIPASAVETRATVSVRVPGYARIELMLDGPLPIVEVPLKQIKPRATYLSVQDVSNCSLRDVAVVLQGQTIVNALVIDMKGDRGDTPYPSAACVAVGVVPE